MPTDPLARLAAIPAIPLGQFPTPIEEMRRLAVAVGTGARVLVKRDDAISFGFGGNKVRKLGIVAADAVAAGADTLVTIGGIQSNHARATAATAAKLGMRCTLVANGARPDRPTANALLDALLGADIEYVASREERVPGMHRAIARLQSEGRRPYEVPLGASTPRGAMGFARAVGEMIGQGVTPDVIVHATSSGGTQAGLVAGCALLGLPTKVVGVSADDPSESVRAQVATVVLGIYDMLGADLTVAPDDLDVDDTFVGDGYGVPTDASREAQRLAAQNEALFVDHTYTAKALAAMIAYLRSGAIDRTKTVLFWHTGGQVGLFA
jgi:1-aminocyclopropane-1-carboxylate deaminase/D-cysteine desulfhydrase-like pyridoxal-dependent ACC family enzyme